MASIDHGGVIKPFAFQTTPAPAIFLPYWNGGTLGDMFKRVKDYGTDEYDVFQRLTILKKNHPEQISKIQELERFRLFLVKPLYPCDHLHSNHGRCTHHSQCTSL